MKNNTNHMNLMKNIEIHTNNKKTHENAKKT